MKKITIPDITGKKNSGDKITMLTAYEAGFSAMIDKAGIDIVLVGDSLGMVVLGYESTVPVTMEEMIHHSRAAARGVKEALIVGDMPFLSYQVSIDESIRNAGRFLKEGGCDAIKLEGGEEVCDTVRALRRAGIPVMGHIGLTPQTASQLGGYKVQGKDSESARKLLHDAIALQKAGAFSIVLECIPDGVAKIISDSVSIHTIGIGAGRHCDGQVLVTHDLLGIFEKFVPRFVKTYVHLAPQIQTALQSFKEEVESGTFPDAEHSFTMELNPEEILKGENEQ